MRLDKSDVELFYQLWFPLLDFVNQKYHVCPDTGRIDKRHGVDAQDAKATVLIPFRGNIISDGLVVPYQIYFGKGARDDFKDAYMNAKRNNTIRFTI